MKHLTALLLFAGLAAAHADPQLTSWFTANSGKYARLYQSTANETAGTTSTTWSRGTGTQGSPVYADVNEINHSASWVYIRTSGLASHIMGPWYLDAAKTQNFPNFPSNTATVYRIPRTPVIPATKTLTGLGATGRMVNGVSMFDSRDAFSYVNASATDATPVNGLTGDGIWNRDGYHNEGVTFDPGLAHQAGNNYHYHAHPIALRYQLGDHVDYNATTNRYTEGAGAPTAHSPIVAWAADGLPVYGPYGYSSPLDAGSGVRRMVSGFALRDGTNGTTAITVRQVLPPWAQRVQGRTTLTASQYGPAVSTTYALGHYIEDFDYRGDLGQAQGVDFDLNEQNVRYCVTPEFPSGTWAYFTPINSDGTPQYPYTTGRAYYGDPTGGGTTAAVMNADTPLTQQFIGGANKALAIGTPNVSGTTVTLTWSAVEGGTYSVDASAASNFSPFTNKASGLVSTDISKSTSYTALGTSGTEYGRVNRTALATYDSNGQTAATVAQSTTTSYSLTPNDPPTITGISNQTLSRNGATSALSFTVGDTETAAASLTVTASSSDTTLVPNANIVISGTGASRTVTVTPALGQSGTATITVTVSDGTTTTSTTFTVTVKRPNILFIIADDYGIDASSLYNTSGGVSLPPTPNIASLAANGVKFTNAYGYPTCSPSRSAVLTGRYGFRTGTGDVASSASNNLLQSSEFTLPDAFAANSPLDYQLKQFGKWHLGGGNQAPCSIGGWPAFAGSLQGAIADYTSWTKVVTDGTGPGTSSTTSTTYATTDVVNDAVSFINTQTAANKPWLAWVAFNAPHTPLHLPPTSLCPTYASLSGTPADIAANPVSYRNAMVEAMDTEIGRLLASVDLANTDIIFIGDNGTAANVLQSPFPAGHGKDTLYEGGIRVPLIIRGPDVVSPGRTSEVLTHVADLYSTMLGMAGINVATTVPAGVTLDSQSLLTVLQDQAVTRPYLYDEQFDLQTTTGGRTLRDSQYKLIRNKSGTDEFYDLAADPYEGTNLLAGGYGAMTGPQQAAHNTLVTQLGSYNTAPTISTVADQSTTPDTATGAIAFTVGDAELSSSILTVTGSSSNTALVPNANVVLGGSGASRTVTITPAAALTGTSTITLSVTDGTFTTSTSFVLTVASTVLPVINAIAMNPAVPTSDGTVTITANVQASAGRTLTGVQLTYSTDAEVTNTVFDETMGTAAVTGWTGAGTVYPWTVVFQSPPATSPFRQTSAGNHTPVGQGNQFGMEVFGNSPNLANNHITTANDIDATGTSGTVEFWVNTSGLTGTQGWDFQTSTDGSTWTTRISEPTAANYAFTLKSYTLSAAERVSTLKLRFRFAGGGMNQTPSIRLDDIKVAITGTAAPVNVTMYDDGAHGDGAAGDGIFGASIPTQSAGTTVTHTITATDNQGGSTTTGSAAYTVATPAPVLAVTPSGALASSGPSGGAFSPASAGYTLTNADTGTLGWSAGKNAAWLDLSAASGTLAAGASTTVTATINSTADSLAVGNYSDTISFTNTSNGSGSTTRSANIAVLSTNANLSSLLPSAGSLSPAFFSGATDYTATVANSVASLTITPTAQDGGATLNVNGVAVASGSASGAMALTVGDNVISTVVTPQSGTPTKTYTVTVTRLSAIQSWRQAWFGTPGNSGSAADTADPYHTGLSNLTVFAFFGPGQDPATAGALQLPQPVLDGGNFYFSFTQPSGVSGITYGAQWSATMLANDWHDIADTGSGSQHIFSVAVGGSTRLSMRLTVSSP